MECSDVRALLLDLARGRLASDVATSVRAHLATCAACQDEEARDRELTVLLEQRFARPAAPASLRRAVRARYGPPDRLESLRRVARKSLPGMALAFAALLGLVLWQRGGGGRAMLNEAVNDHLRVLYTEHPLDVESGGIHQVKPWFEGRLDFAPVVPFGGDEEFKLRGGASAYFLDRRAAAFIFQRHLHVMTLLVFRADGLPWPTAPTLAVGQVRATSLTERGFHVLLWRSADLGYALVSDVDAEQMVMLAGRVVNGR